MNTRFFISIVSFLFIFNSCGLIVTPFDEGYEAYSNGDYKKAFEILKPLADNGHSKSQFILGVMYDNGRGVKKSEQEAFKYFLSAAEQGMVEAQLNVGYIYDRGVHRNYEEALKWYTLAAEKNYPISQQAIGVMYNNGRGVEQNVTEAEKWFRKAAINGNPDAQHNIGYFYLKGIALEKDEQLAFDWFTKAAENGMVDSQFNLALMLIDGEPDRKDYVEAYKWLTISVSLTKDIEKQQKSQNKLEAIKDKLTDNQILEAESLANEWLENNTIKNSN